MANPGAAANGGGPSRLQSARTRVKNKSSATASVGRTVRSIGIVPFLIIVAGCSPSPKTVATSHSGDLGQFILQTVVTHGGHAKTTNALPAIQSQWRAEVLTGAEYLHGRERVSIIIAGDHFQQVTSYLGQAFGPPSQPATLHTNGIVHGWYSIRDIGVGLQFYRDEKETGLILVGELQK